MSAHTHKYVCRLHMLVFMSHIIIYTKHKYVYKCVIHKLYIYAYIMNIKMKKSYSYDICAYIIML